MMEKRDNTELISALTSAIRSEFATLSISEEMHREHHEYIKTYIEEQRVKKERAEKIKTHVIGWGIVAFLSGIGTGMYHIFQYLREHLK